MIRSYWLIINGDGQPLFILGKSPKTKKFKGMAWLFITKKDAQDFVKRQKKLQIKHKVKRKIIEVVMVEKKFIRAE